MMLVSSIAVSQENFSVQSLSLSILKSQLASMQLHLEFAPAAAIDYHM